MNAVRAVALLTGLGIVGASPSDSPFAKVVETVNSGNHGWTAEIPRRLASPEQARALCGSRRPGPSNSSKRVLAPRSDLAPPAAFDARTAFANCTGVQHRVRDQSYCANCWAIAATQAFEAARCAKTGEDLEYSIQDTSECCAGNSCGYSQGCQGGHHLGAMQWLTEVGVCTGGGFNTAIGCKPYALPPCAHGDEDPATFPNCPSQEATFACASVCSNTHYNTSYPRDKLLDKGGRTHEFLNTDYTGMMQAIMANGAIAADFQVFTDFLSYKSGVYKHVTGYDIGGHAITVIGWGAEPAGGDYWLCRNSWNDQWGEKGYFKIARGRDEVGIEDGMVSLTWGPA